MSETLFADAFYWVALLSPRDQHHSAAISLSRTIQSTRLITTEEVLNEFLTHFCQAGPYWRAKAVAFVADIRTNPLIDVLPQTPDGFNDALVLYEQRLDKDYSLTDCRSMIAMKSLALQNVLTNDYHFTQEGFTVLFP